MAYSAQRKRFTTENTELILTGQGGRVHRTNLSLDHRAIIEESWSRQIEDPSRYHQDRTARPSTKADDMAPRIIYDLTTVDWNEVEFDLEAIRKVNPQRYEFEQITAISKLLLEENLVIGYRDVRSDEFWVRGHIPGNPLLPGVLMLESAAQLGSFFCGKYYDDDERFFGFGAIDGVKFRGSVVPGDRLILIGNALRLSPRRAVFYTQGIVGDKLVFEAQLTGLAMS